jgi:hypothetical protein
MLLGSLSPVIAQEPEVQNVTDMDRARNIKLERMAKSWDHLPIEILLKEGTRHAGNFAGFESGVFRLKQNLDLMSIPAQKVESVIIKRRPQDLVLAGLMSLGTGALFAGAISLSGGKIKTSSVNNAAALGCVLGFGVGWRVFYQDTVIKIE